MSSFDLSSVLGISDIGIYIDKVNNELDDYLTSSTKSINQPISRLIHASGKRFRPALVIAASMVESKKVNKQVISGAAAIEMLHIGSLVHDDIIDQADTRWNIATVSATEGINQAIIVGDYLFAKALSLSSSISSDIATALSSAFASICLGESLELADQFNTKRSLESLFETINYKTASLISAACQVGGLCAGLGNKQIEALGDYGKYFGLSFQLVDDLLDFLSDTELSGKPACNDVINGVYTMPLILALKGPKKAVIEDWLSGDLNNHLGDLLSLLIQDGYITKTIDEAKKYVKLTQESLNDFKHPLLDGLIKLPSTYLEWAFKNLVSPANQKVLYNI